VRWREEVSVRQSDSCMCRPSCCWKRGSLLADDGMSCPVRQMCLPRAVAVDSLVLDMMPLPSLVGELDWSCRAYCRTRPS
jgi:hypothetical protein